MGLGELKRSWKIVTKHFYYPPVLFCPPVLFYLPFRLHATEEEDGKKALCPLCFSHCREEREGKGGEKVLCEGRMPRNGGGGDLRVRAVP